MALKEVKVPVTSGKKKCQSSQGDRCSFRHGTEDRAQKPEHTAATPSEPSMSRGRSVSKEKSIQGRSNVGAILRQQCRDYLKKVLARDRLVNIGILPSVNSSKPTLRQASIQEKKGQLLGKIHVKVPHQRSPFVKVRRRW